MTSKIIIVTGASSRFGHLSANALAQSGYTVYAAMREIGGRNAQQAGDMRAYAREQGVDLRVIELDGSAQISVDGAVALILAEHGRIDVIVHSAGHMAFGPAEAFTPEQFAELFDLNVVSTQRVNRAILPHMRRRGQGLLVWVSCSSAAGGAPPYHSPHFAAKAGMDALAVQYARELSRWGIETSIVVPGSFGRGSDNFSRFEKPGDKARAAEYDEGPYLDITKRIQDAVETLVPAGADPGLVAGAITCLVDTPFGERPFRVHVDPSEDGAAVAFSVIDRVRDDMLKRMGFPDLLKPALRPAPT
jgi:NAD(P)-dependent dehydrogenase (short-subunit alcohol dehydrogenase family)